MRILAAASMAAFAALVITSHMAADAANHRAHEEQGMAQAPAAEIWYISGVATVDGTMYYTQFYRHFVKDNEEGRQALVTFPSKDSCDAARADDPDIAGVLARFESKVAERGGTTVVSCERFVHPPTDTPA